MSDYEQSVFISYAWGGGREEIVNRIDESLQQRGIKIVRDKRDLGYKGSISRFMERIGQGNCVILIVSDKYLRSPNCMFELVEIAENKNILDRIFPVVLADANIYKAAKQAQYIKYWEDEIKELTESIRGLDPAHLEGIYDQLNLYHRIRDNISRLTAILSDMNTLTPETHNDSDFGELYAAVEKRIIGTSMVPLLTTKFDLLPYEPETVGIPEGKFLMGCPDGMGIEKYDQHDVVIPSFRIGLKLVTNFQYHQFIGKTLRQVRPAMHWKGQLIPDGMEHEPVLGVTWEDAIEFCAWLSEETRKNYSLPNEAQWERACRGPYPCAENMGKTLEWTCSLWGETRGTPKYKTPWTNADGRNDTSVQSRIRRDLRVLRGYPGADDTDVRRSCARYGRSVDDSGYGDTRYGFRVILTL